MTGIAWWIETGVFPASAPSLCAALEARGSRWVRYADDAREPGSRRLLASCSRARWARRTGNASRRAGLRARSAIPSRPDAVIAVATEVATLPWQPAPLYCVDVAEVDRGHRVLELNPFSGADLYGCDRDAVITAVERVAQSIASSRADKVSG